MAVAVVATSAYVGWAVSYGARHPVISLVHIGSHFQSAQGGSPAIARLGRSAAETIGYDGQFNLYMALDPARARWYMDNPAYRYARPLYPILARVVALGRADLVPWTLVFVGIAGVGVGAFALARILHDSEVSPWFALLFPAYPGVFEGITHDLGDPLAYGLVLVGVLILRSDSAGRAGAAGGVFALAGLARDTTLLFPLGIAAWLLSTRRARRAAVLAVVSVVPYLALKVGLAVWLHSWGTGPATSFTWPFLGLFGQWSWSELQLQQVLGVVAPALLAAGFLWKAEGPVTPRFVLLGLNVLVLVVLLPAPSYVGYLSSGRISIGVVVAFLLALPTLVQRRAFAHAWIVLALWLLPWWTSLPEALNRGAG